MVGQPVEVDDTDNIRHLIHHMGIPSSLSDYPDVSSIATPPGSPSAQCNEPVYSTLPQTIDLAAIGAQPLSIPSPKKPSHDSTPSSNSPASPFTSFHTRGILAPCNTPKTNPVSPFVGPAQTHEDKIAPALADFDETIEDELLSEPVLASKSSNSHKSLLPGAGILSRSSTPTKVTDVYPAVNDSFAKISLQVADSENDMGHDLNSERNIGKEQPTTALPITHNMETNLLPTSACGSIRPPHASGEHCTLANDEDHTGIKIAASPENEAVHQVSANTNPINKETVTVAKATTGVISQLGGGHDPQSFSDKTKDSVSQMSTATPAVSHQDASWATLPSPLVSHPITPSHGEYSGAETADIAAPSHARTPVTDELLGQLKALELSGSLVPEEQVLLTELTTRVLARSISERNPTAMAGNQSIAPARKTVTPTKERVKSADKPAEPNPLSNFLNKWATESKDVLQTRSNTSLKYPDTASASSPPSVPSKAAHAKADKDLEDREHKTYFNAWPGQEKRDRPAAQIRKVIIKGLPANATPSFVASLIYHGPLEEIYMHAGSATVRFINGDDCTKFYDDTANGIVYGKDAQNRERVVFVEQTKDVDVISGLLRIWIEKGVTRCVRAVGVDDAWSLDALRKLGENKGSRIESIVDGKTAGGARSVIWRFCKMEEAVKFKATLSHNEEWEHCNIHHAADPCATATGVHFDN